MSKSLYDRMRQEQGLWLRGKNHYFNWYTGQGALAEINAILSFENDTVSTLETDAFSDKIKVKTTKGDIYHYYPDGSLSLISRGGTLKSAGTGMTIQGKSVDMVIIDDPAKDWIDNYTMRSPQSRRNQLLLTC